MVVVRALLIAALSAGGASAQSARAWVDKTTQKVNEPFFIHVEASGGRVSAPTIPAVPGLTLRAPQSSYSTTLIGGRMKQTVSLSYVAIADRPGSMVFPSLDVEVDGKTVETDPIELTILGAISNPDATERPVQAWVDSTTVSAGEPFKIYVEGIGVDVEIPDPGPIDGITLDLSKTITSRTAARRVGDRKKRVQHGFHATARRTGRVQVPPFTVKVDGRTYTTLPFDLTVVEQRPTRPETQTELTTEDLIFTEMHVDKEEVYQGEPVLLTMELWRIDNDRIQTGSFRGADIRYPTTEGFYGAPLEPTSRMETLGAFRYEVTADRRVLYPTSTGLLTIGTWHWEGVARWPRRNSFFFHDEQKYEFDEGPITINVKPLPEERPDEFSGAVGQFDLRASLSEKSFLQGVPFKLEVGVRGSGNPDAIGEPHVPTLEWAHVSSPERQTESSISPDAQLRISKRFTYTLTPLEAGEHRIDRVAFTYFDPAARDFRTESAGPFVVDVLPSAESGQRLVVGADVTLDEERVSILGEDIRPLMRVEGTLESSDEGTGVLPVLFVVPVLLYAGVFAYTARLRRFAGDRAFARRQRAKATALKRFSDVTSEPDPSDALYRTIVDFLGDAFNVDAAGLTSSDAKQLLNRPTIDPAHAANIVKVLRACERARYASQPLSANEVGALLEAAEAAVRHVDDVSRKGSAA